MSAGYEISPGSAADIPELKAAFLSLHDHHRALSAVALTEPDDHAVFGPMSSTSPTTGRSCT
jgi:hypothetical protein